MPSDHPRLRRDLTWRRFVMEGQDSYIFKDEVSQAYTKLDAISGTLALQLDGTVSPGRLLEFARERWPSLDFDEDYIADALADLKRLKFLDDPFERNAMMEARVRQDRAQINASTFKNIFYIPLGTVNPDRFLTRTYPRVAFLFQPFFVRLGLALFAFSIYVVWLNRDHIAGGATNLFLGAGQGALSAVLLWLIVTGAVIIHELGHGYAVKHFGGRVHRLGFIFVFGFLCMFCDTSDSHLFPERKHRAYVALAGTYTELYVATLVTMVWWITPMGSVVNQLAYNVVLFVGISGMLFNYNPLIKTDGYYVLSDVLDMPSLEEDAFAYLGYLFRHYALGMKVECPVEGRRRKRILATYGSVSILYSVSLTLLVFQILRHTLIQYLAFAGALISVVFLVFVLGRAFRPLAHTARLWVLDHHGWIRRQFAPIVGCFALSVGLFFLLPVPGRKVFDATLRPAREVAVVVPEELRLERATFTAGQRVEAGTPLATLDPESLGQDLVETSAQARKLRVDASVAQRRGADADAEAAREHATAEEHRSEVFERRVRGAVLRAPFRGVVLTPQDPERIGEWLERGDTLCMVADFSALRAEMRVTELDLDDVAIGAPVRMRLRSAPAKAIRGRVTAIEPASGTTLEGRVYRVWVELTGAPAEPRAGLTGRAWVGTPKRSPASQLYRWIVRFIRADLWV